MWVDKMSKNSTTLEDVDFSNVNCSEVTFSKSSFGGLKATNLNFFHADLRAACFDGAKLSWTEGNYNPSEENWYEYDQDSEGQPLTFQSYYPAFFGADLAGCSFQGTQFEHADFRGARNVKTANFKDASGLESCFFDDGDKPVVAGTK